MKSEEPQEKEEGRMKKEECRREGAVLQCFGFPVLRWAAHYFDVPVFQSDYSGVMRRRNCYCFVSDSYDLDFGLQFTKVGWTSAVQGQKKHGAASGEGRREKGEGV